MVFMRVFTIHRSPKLNRRSLGNIEFEHDLQSMCLVTRTASESNFQSIAFSLILNALTKDRVVKKEKIVW